MRLLDLSESELIALYEPRRQPWLQANMVVSLDGSVAVDGDSKPLSCPADRRLYQLLRSRSDAVMVGARTASHPGYAKLAAPLVIVTNSGSVTTSAAQPIVITTRSAAASAHRTVPHATIIEAGKSAVDLHQAKLQLRERGINHLLCEGGPTLLHALSAQDLIDDLCLTIAPFMVGAEPRLMPLPLPTQNALQLQHVLSDGDWLFTRYLTGRIGDTVVRD